MTFIIKTQHCYFSFGTNFSKGVGIVILNDNIKVKKYHMDIDGRLIYLDIIYNDISYRMINVYAPNNSVARKEFFD